jgi:uncharacterized protein (TIGR02996 family)
VRLVRGSEVWEIHHEGTVVRVGEVARRFLTGEHARVAYEKAVAEQCALGFTETPDVLDDLDARLVLADDLQQRGDPQGELIAVQTALAGEHLSPAERKKLAKRENALLDANHELWWGPLAQFLRKRGNKYPLKPALEVTWDRGFVDSVRIQRALKFQFDQIYGQLRKLPIARNLRRLVLGDPQLDTAMTTVIHYGAIFSVMEREGVPPHLKELVIGDVTPARRPRIHLGDARAVLSACTHLERLEISAGSGTFAPFTSPTLRELAIAGIARTSMAALIDAKLPALVELDVTGVEIRAFVELLLGSPLLAQLQRLTLSHCHMQDPDLAIFYMHWRRFEHLAHLDLRGNHFTQMMVKDVRTRLPQLQARGS